MHLYKNTPWIVVSSIALGIPGVFYSPLPATVLVASSAISVNYWRNPIYGMRRTADIYMSRIAVAYFISQFYDLDSDFRWIACIAFCYWRSCLLFELRNQDWWKYHVAFHLFSMWELVRVNRLYIANK